MRAEIVEAMAAVRRRTFDLVGHLPEADLERQITPIMSPLVWDLAHIAAYEDLWLVHRHAGLPLLHPELAALSHAFATPPAPPPPPPPPPPPAAGAPTPTPPPPPPPAATSTTCGRARTRRSAPT